jgi:alkylated DNA nucleotide flippase Atl1
MEARELPPWALKTDEHVAELCAPKEEKLEESVELDGSRRQRQKTKVTYGEKLSEEAWLRAVENGSLDDALDRAEKDVASKRKREEDAIANRPEKRAEIEAAAKRRKIEMDDEEAVRQAIAAIPPTTLRAMKGVIHDVTSVIDREGRLVSRTFQELPDRSNTEYYTVVRSPVRIALPAIVFSNVSPLAICFVYLR